MGIREIAEKAGVSKTTVSLALNGHRGVSHETRMRIIALAREMNYRVPGDRPMSTPSNGPILLARLRKHGLLLNQDQSVFIMDYIDSINKAVSAEGYQFEIFESQCGTLQGCVEEIQKRHPKGVILIGTELFESDLELLQSFSVPYVVIDTFYDHVTCDFVDMANINAVYQVIDHLVLYGHSKIQMVTSSMKSGNIVMRERGFSLAMNHNHLLVDGSSFISVEPGFDGAYQTMKAYLEDEPLLPEALFCYNDVAAFGVIKALKEKKYRIPRDVSVVGFDDLPMAAMMDPHLTTVKIPTRRIGEKAVHVLLEKIKTKWVLEPSSWLVQGNLVARDSVIRRT
ncbi:MAG: LacI family DNA-binding transcriptional regulator [Sphaerochaetaceae bacterium]|nr:LacI family DNA-binding transcriptional regulator [Sphaerochaetaceae bacterium]